MPVLFSVHYPNRPEDPGRFDEAYYLERHIALVRARWTPMGLLDLRVLRGVGTPDGGPPPFLYIAELTFTSAEALRAAIAAHGEEIFGHIPRYTDIPATMQVSETIG